MLNGMTEKNIMSILHRTEKQQTEETEDSSETVLSQKTEDSEKDRYIRELASNPEKLNESGDGDIKQVYRLFKKECSAEKTGKRNFKKIKKYTKTMIKKDKKRTGIRHIRRIGKYLALLGIIIAVYVGVKYRFVPDNLPKSADEIMPCLSYYAQFIHDHCPGIEIGLRVFVFGIAVYLISVMLTKIKDRILIRRIVCKAVAENLTLNDVIRLSVLVHSGTINDIADFYPLREYCEVGGRW